MLWNATPEEQLIKAMQDSIMLEGTTDINRQAFPRVLINDGQEPESPSIPGPVMYEVIAPYVVAMFRTEPYA